MNKITFVATSLLALLAATAGGSALAQRDYEADRNYCASGRSGLDFNSCMRQIQRQSDERYERRDYGYDPRGGDPRRGYEDDRQPSWGRQPPPPRYGYEPEWGQRRGPEPRELSKTQQRVMNNCAMLPPNDQPRCRAAVMSTVPR